MGFAKPGVLVIDKTFQKQRIKKKLLAYQSIASHTGCIALVSFWYLDILKIILHWKNVLLFIIYLKYLKNRSEKSFNLYK